MIPSTTGFLNKEFEIAEQPGFTYKMRMDESKVRGYTDGLEAVKQEIGRAHV